VAVVDIRRTVKDRRADAPLAADPEEDFWSKAAQAAVVGIFLLLFLGFLELARTILIPALSALMIGLMLSPVSARAARLGIPSVVTAAVLLILVVMIFNLAILLLSAPAIEWVGKAPEVGRIVQQKMQFLQRPLAALEDMRRALTPQGQNPTLKVDIVGGPAFVQPILAVLTPALGQLLTFFGTLFFVLLGWTRLRHALVARFENRDARLRTLRILNEVEHNLTSYLSLVAVINAVVGTFAALIAYLIGLPNPLAWGVLGFVLNFIPYIGPLIMEFVLFAVGLVTFPTLTQAVLAPLLYVAFTTLEGHFITPAIMGRRLTLSPLTVFLALIFWTWLWGPVGAFLAVPILIVGQVAVTHLFAKDEPVIP
jgi:predicted PurR-regulated permease PerM